MNNLNPTQLLTLLKSGNPQQVATQIIEQNYKTDPLMQNLLQMARSGNTQGIQQFAIQYFKNQGTDLNAEMNNLINALKQA